MAANACFADAMALASGITSSAVATSPNDNAAGCTAGAAIPCCWHCCSSAASWPRTRWYRGATSLYGSLLPVRGHHQVLHNS